MKKVIFSTTLLIFCTLLNAQIITYGQVSKATKKIKGKITEYHCENGQIFKVGDMITLGKPLNANNAFLKISESDGFSSSSFPSIQISGYESEIKKFKIHGTKRSGYFVVAVGKTSIGLTNYYITIEEAIENGEIETSIMTRSQAIDELKEAKDLLDLEIMTQQEYDTIKEKLIPIIKSN
jgi:hypothetical protein